MFPDGDVPNDFGVKTLVQTSDWLVMRVAAGDKVALLKAFNQGVEHASAARHREIAVLMSLSRTDLIPRVFAYNKTANWILSDFVQSKGLGDVITAENAVGYARSLGQWYGKYTDTLIDQSTTDTSNWYAYIGKYKSVAKSVDYGKQRAVLEAMPITKRLVAKNDSYLQNFLVDADDNLIGIDFEKAELKPYGWDILVTARLLVRLFPGMMIELTEALINGWGRGTDVLDADAFLQLTRIFATTTAFTVTHESEVRLRARLQAFNTQADQPASHIHETPYMRDDLVDQSPERKALLRAYLELVATAPGGRSAKIATDDDVVVKHLKPELVSAAPATAESTFCGTCKGSCCQPGADNMAFLKSDVLEKAQAALDLQSRQAVIQHYMDLLPKQHVSGSCYFHSADGCTIPRNIRSDTCNAYKCHALRSFSATIGDLTSDARILLFAGDEGGARRARVIGGQSVYDVDPGLLEPSNAF